MTYVRCHWYGCRQEFASRTELDAHEAAARHWDDPDFSEGSDSITVTDTWVESEPASASDSLGVNG